jgi:large subunit ribosomal protein L20
MPRVKSGPTKHARHKKVLDAAKGFTHANRKRFKTANEAVLHAGQYAYISRRLKKRDFRKLWITRINAGLETIDPKLSYSVFMKLVKDNQITLNRKMLSEIAVNDAASFKAIVDKVYGK